MYHIVYDLLSANRLMKGKGLTDQCVCICEVGSREGVVAVEPRSCVKVKVAVLGSPSLISLRFLWT